MTPEETEPEQDEQSEQEPQSTKQEPQSTNHGFWWALGIVGSIAVLLWIVGRSGPSALLGLALLAVVGALYPPIAIGFGGIILLHLIYAHGSQILKKGVQKP